MDWSVIIRLIDQPLEPDLHRLVRIVYEKHCGWFRKKYVLKMEIEPVD